MTDIYTPEFFAEHHGTVTLSASVVVPLVVDLLHPRSVLDVGCGQGEWLGAFGLEEELRTGDGGRATQEVDLHGRHGDSPHVHRGIVASVAPPNGVTRSGRLDLRAAGQAVKTSASAATARNSSDR